ncbi:hypothetical protein J2810_004647 [Chryseobacterium rhizosphaerae]|uniref:hypothetical protein n=1 Tax=Chryseobacterium rhizosphaerae TaxID=395937 RepID=UPI00285F612E|nr:hypothetical protein [Chryseobacterium rhizosphaerae]MDR6548557.1 hypothetical protein [Chryseobacterium rhizosphaerae]
MKKKKIKLKILSRSAESIRKNAVYDFYNANALSKQKEGMSLTALKTFIAKKFSYKGYQPIANIITQEDSKRRAEISEWLFSLSKELFITLHPEPNDVTQSNVVIKRGRFSVEVCITLKYDVYGEGKNQDYGITSKEITLINAYHNNKLMYLIGKDRELILQYFSDRIIFDLVPPERS